MSRIEAKFAALRGKKRLGLIAYLTVGYPDVETTLAMVPALAEAGVDVFELGVPFSDPLADGATIQHASHVALERGVTPGTCLEVAGELRRHGLQQPLILMGYYNPILRYGVERFCDASRRAGVDGFIVPDLPPEEATDLHVACKPRGLALVPLLAPTASEERIQTVVGTASGFVYCVSLTGVTGARRDLSPELFSFLDRVRTQTTLPLAVGFGISTREHLDALTGRADAAIIGSALIDLVGKLPDGERIAGLQKYVASLRD
ncbi:MAG: tryptophan synthase subunit alpha [Chloroflexota bacterium]|nr:MAG: tryptophan synthase subunit alpha [Chloroflexota bacterium]